MTGAIGLVAGLVTRDVAAVAARYVRRVPHGVALWIEHVGVVLTAEATSHYVFGNVWVLGVVGPLLIALYFACRAVRPQPAPVALPPPPRRRPRGARITAARRPAAR